MPQHSLLPDDPIIVGLRIEVVDHSQYWEAGGAVEVYTRSLDGDWKIAGIVKLPGTAWELLPSVVSDALAAWMWEDRRAILRECQRNERMAKVYEKEHRYDDDE